jgi:hypothetical protein
LSERLLDEVLRRDPRATGRGFQCKGRKGRRDGVSETAIWAYTNTSLIRAAVLSHLARSAGNRWREDQGSGPWRWKKTVETEGSRQGQGRFHNFAHMAPRWSGIRPSNEGLQMDLPEGRLKRLALTSALSAKAQQGSITVFTELQDGCPKTKTLYSNFLKKLGCRKERLLLPENEPNWCCQPGTFLALELLGPKTFRLTRQCWLSGCSLRKDAVRKLEEVLS